MKLLDPIKFKNLCWPKVRFYKKQMDLIYSVKENDETVCVAGNMLGKDFAGGFLALWAFLQPMETRVITTSVKDDHLRVLWGEINRFIDTSEKKLPLIVNYRHIRKIVNGKECPISYLKGMVSETGEGLSGHHARFTLLLVDEASGASDHIYKAGQGWMKRFCAIGNPNPCTNFFYRAVEGDNTLKDRGGDIPREGEPGFYRKVIQIKGEDSPSVQRGLLQASKGQKPDNVEVLPGVLTYREYKRRRKVWDKIRQSIGLDAEFYRGGEILLYPPDWLDYSAELAQKLQPTRRGEALGVDSAEGGDDTSWSVIDRYGLIHLRSEKTNDTTRITKVTKELMMTFGVPADKVMFDRGGGGKQHADRLRAEGFDVRTVGFGESVSQEKRSGMTPLVERKDTDETKYAYKNRRAQMYGELRLAIEPENDFRSDILSGDFAIPDEYTDLRAQLAPLPLLYDPEGRLYLPPKKKSKPESKEVTIMDILGRSPDQADGLVVALHSLLHESSSHVAGAF